MELQKPPTWLYDNLPQAGKDFLDAGGWYLVLAIVAVLVLAIVAMVFRGIVQALSRRRKQPDPEKNLAEDLGTYPPAPGKPGPRRLHVEGHPARIRLVVLAPQGKQDNVDAGKAEAVLELVVKGLGALAQQDHPRVRIWPRQLSNQGFAVSFHRLIRKPEPDSRPSRWVLVAGQAQAGQRKVLVGLALQTDEKTSLGKLTVEPERWNEVLRIKSK
jgi:hypothetical protein